MVKIRLAEAKDRKHVVRLIKSLTKESPRYEHVNFVKKKINKVVAIITARKLGLVAEHNGKVIGVIAAIEAEHIFSFDKFLTDLTVYISPKFRGGFTIVKMIREFEKLAHSRGINELILGVSTSINSDRTVGIYQKLGYNLSGFSLVKFIR